MDSKICPDCKKVFTRPSWQKAGHFKMQVRCSTCQEVVRRNRNKNLKRKQAKPRGLPPQGTLWLSSTQDPYKFKITKTKVVLGPDDLFLMGKPV